MPNIASMPFYGFSDIAIGNEEDALSVTGIGLNLLSIPNQLTSLVSNLRNGISLFITDTESKTLNIVRDPLGLMVGLTFSVANGELNANFSPQEVIAIGNCALVVVDIQVSQNTYIPPQTNYTILL